MANTRQDIILPRNTWVNLYAASGIAVGTAVSVYNKGSQPLNLAISPTVPTVPFFGVPVYTGADGFMMIVEGESGLWAYCTFDGIVLVQEN